MGDLKQLQALRAAQMERAEKPKSMAGSTPARLPRVGAETQVRILPKEETPGLVGTRGMAAGKDRQLEADVVQEDPPPCKSDDAGSNTGSGTKFDRKVWMREYMVGYRKRIKAKKGNPDA